MKTNVHFFIISVSILLRMKKFQTKFAEENENTHLIFKTFFSKTLSFMR